MEKKIEIAQNWVLESIEPWNWSNTNRYKNYLAIVSRDDEGIFNYSWCKSSSENDEYFYVKDVKVGDILMAGYKDFRKPYGKKLYYKVLEKTDEYLLLYCDTTYRKAMMHEANGDEL